MADAVEALVALWIETFGEPPVVADAELMAALLAEHDPGFGASIMTDKRFKPGDAVRWDHSQGATTGEVVRKLTSPTRIKGHKVAASKDHPEYLVESGKTGARAAHTPEELRKA